MSSVSVKPESDPSLTGESSFGRFFLPGPTDVHPDVARAQLRPMIGHRTKAMEDINASVQGPLRQLFRTARPVYVTPSSATGMMEAAVRNGVRKRVLSLVNGAFSERFFNIAESCGFDAERLDVPWGSAHTPDMVRDAMRGKGFDSITVVHSETSTGVLNPIGEIARAAHEMGDVAVLVDSVSGVGGAPMDADAWKLDFVLTGSQKALAVPPGLAFGVANEALLARARTSSARGTYFDAIELEEFVQKNQTPNTPAVGLMYALQTQMARITAEGVDARWARHAAMARHLWAWVDEMRGRGIALSLPAAEPIRSPTVSCINLPSGRPSGPILAELQRRGYTVSPGYGKMKDPQIRIGHMGDHSVEGLDTMLGVLGEVLAE